MVFFKEGNPVKTAQWILSLTKKMDALGCDYKFFAQRSYEMNSDNAMMRAHNSDYQPRPVVMVGAEWFKLENLYLTPVIMHEMGHVIDYKKCKHSMIKYYQKYGTLEMEIRAWENAFRIALEVGFTHFDDMKEFAEKCLTSYHDFGEQNNGFDNDNRCGFKGESPSRAETMERLSQAHLKAIKSYKRELLGV